MPKPIGGAHGGPTVSFVKEYWFPVPPARLWEILGRFDSYPSWWRWLRDFTAVPADKGMDGGTELRGTIVPPLPGRLSLRVTLDRCERPARVEATIEGDVRGQATLDLVASGEGTAVTARWTLHMVKPPLRLATRLTPPLARWSHDQVVAMAVAGFRRSALASVEAVPP